MKLVAAADRVREELAKTRRNPRRILRLRQRKYRRLLYTSFTGTPGAWRSDSDVGMRARAYPSYDDYLRHQQSKPGEIRFTDHDDELCAALAARLRDDRVPTGSAALCLGARFGGEVRAFRSVGCFAVGIDLRTAPESEEVLYGDFQDLQFPDACVDFVYTNSLDHAYDITAVLSEIARVLKPSGQLIVDAVRGAEEGHPPGIWECFYWSTTDDLVDLLRANGFSLIHRVPFAEPWDGEHLRFTPATCVSGPSRFPSSTRRSSRRDARVPGRSASGGS
jgi:SAM-dependent methyltransferase